MERIPAAYMTTGRGSDILVVEYKCCCSAARKLSLINISVDFIKRISTRVTTFGAIYLAVLAIIPSISYAIAGVYLPFTASSLLIAVSVAMETVRQLESQMLMRHYKGFLK